MLRITVPPEMSGQRFDKYLKRLMPQIPSGILYKSLRKKNITLCGRKADGSEKIESGDFLELFFAPETLKTFGLAVLLQGENAPEGKESAQVKSQAKSQTLTAGMIDPARIVFENEHLLVYNKPAGVLTQKAGPEDESLNEMLLRYLYEKGEVTDASLRLFHPSVGNRLDRNTEGLVLFGKTLAGSRWIAEGLKTHTIQKDYLTICAGIPPKEQVYEAVLSRDGSARVSAVRKTGEGARIRTDIKRIAVSSSQKTVSLVQVRLHTGKTHQIRAQLSAEGYPLMGDPKYGDEAVNAWAHKTFGLRSQLLFAFHMTFPENELGVPAQLTAPPSERFSHILNTLFGEEAYAHLEIPGTAGL